MKIYLVGGAVRDELLGHPYSEKDWVVVGSSPEEMLNLGYKPVGNDFPVFLHPETGEEYALARTERKIAPGYKGFTFHTEKSVSLEQDLQRRDLTINAIAKDADNNLIDPCDGRKDLKDKTLRHVSQAFTEDPVRILRIARFAARYHHLGFSIAQETMGLIKQMVADGETKHLVPERVWQEFHRALSEKTPEIFFQVLQQCNALQDIITSIKDEALTQSLSQLALATNKTDSALIRFCAWCYGMGSQEITSLCQQLSTPKLYHELAIMTEHHCDLINNPKKWSSETLAKLFSDTDAIRKPERFDQVILASNTISTTAPQSNKLREALDIYTAADAQSLIQQGFKGKELGEKLKEIRQENLETFFQANSPA